MVMGVAALAAGWGGDGDAGSVRGIGDAMGGALVSDLRLDDFSFSDGVAIDVSALRADPVLGATKDDGNQPT
jgi:hypothetical protein